MLARRRRAALALLLALLQTAGACADDIAADEIAADDQPTVTPYRPTVSNPADLSAPGWLEFEFGASSDHAFDSTRADTLPWLLKYAFTENSGLLVGGNAYTRIRVAGESRSGFGDTFVEWKQRLPLREGVAFGVEAGVGVPTASSTLGIGKPDYIVNGIFSSDIGAAHLDLNLGGTRYTNHPMRSSAWQSAWAAALSHPLGDVFGVAVELSGNAQHGAEHGHQALAAINYNASRRIVFDFGAAYGLDHAAHDHSVFCGGTFLLGKLN